MVGSGETADWWAGAGSEGAGITNLRDPDFVPVMGNHGGGIEIFHLIVINGGFQGEADLDGLEK